MSFGTEQSHCETLKTDEPPARRSSPYFDLRRDGQGREYMEVALDGMALLRLALTNKGTAFTAEERKQRDFVKWLRHGLLSFGRPGTDGNRYAIEAGIKKRDSGAVIQDYLNDIKPAVKACRLTFPTPAEMKLDMPDTLDWSLDGVRESDTGRWQEPARLEKEKAS